MSHTAIPYATQTALQRRVRSLPALADLTKVASYGPSRP
jgi:hypothetical protein